VTSAAVVGPSSTSDSADEGLAAKEANPPTRILIVGGPGTGKTVLAQRLGSRLSAPVIGLDALAHAPGSSRTLDLPERLTAVRAVAEQSRWVCEGVYLDWTDELAHRAEVVVWLDLAPWRAMSRIVRRHVASTFHGQNRYPGLPRLVRFLWAAAAYFTDRPAPSGPNGGEPVSRGSTRNWVRARRERLVVCSTPADVEAYVQSVAHTAES
jgi:adenylate kinase family enzyme